MRCDRVDFEPGGIAYRHTHPGPGIRYLLFGAITIDSLGAQHTLGPGEAWFERGPTRCWPRRRPTSPRPSFASCCCPWNGPASARSSTSIPPTPTSPRPSARRSSSSSRCAVDAQRRAGPGRPAGAARGRPGLRRPRRELPGRPRRAPRRPAAPRRHPPRERRGEHGRGLRQARPAARASAWSPAGRGPPTRPTASTPRCRTRRRCSCSWGRSLARRSGARPSRSSTTAPSSARWPSG